MLMRLTLTQKSMSALAGFAMLSVFAFALSMNALPQAHAQSSCVIRTKQQFKDALAQGKISMSTANASVTVSSKNCYIDPMQFNVNGVKYGPGHPLRLVDQLFYYNQYSQAMSPGQTITLGGGQANPGCAYQMDLNIPPQTSNDGSTLVLGKIVEGPSCINNAVCEAIGDPTVITAGLSYNMLVAVRNTGNTIWRSNLEFPYRLVHPYGGSNFGASTIQLPSDVGPGQTTGFQVQVTAPSQPGTYTLDWQMEQSRVGRFGTICHKVIVIPGTPASSSLSSKQYSSKMSSSSSKKYSSASSKTYSSVQSSSCSSIRSSKPEKPDYEKPGHKNNKKKWGNWNNW